MKYICSLVTVENIEKSKNFYEKILGQKIVSDYGENVFFEGGFAIHLKRHYQNLIKNKQILADSNNFELYFEANDLNEILIELKKNNIEFIHEIEAQPWGQKVIRFYDYDKNIIEVGEPM